MDYAIVFGDIFKYRGDEYVYFVESPEEDLIFAGRILDVSETSRLRGLQEGREKQGLPTHKAPIFSYVVLSTEEFDKRAVLCAEGLDGAKQLSFPHASLTTDDVTKIKQEIKEGLAPARLKELVELLA